MIVEPNAEKYPVIRTGAASVTATSLAPLALMIVPIVNPPRLWSNTQPAVEKSLAKSLEVGCMKS